MSTTLINAKNICLTYSEKTVLDQVSFEIKAGDFVTLIGPNGAGKSSLIKVLLGLIKPDSGELNCAKNMVIGYTPQVFHPNPFIPISVIDFLNLDQDNRSQSIEKVAMLTGIEGILESPLRNLSGGELQRVLLARALIKKPNILILDEPAQNLDVNGQMHLYKLIQDIHRKQKCAVLMVSHDLHRVMKESTQVLCLYHHICCMGQPETIINDSQFNDLFSEQMDELMTTYKHHHNHCHED